MLKLLLTTIDESSHAWKFWRSKKAGFIFQRGARSLVCIAEILWTGQHPSPLLSELFQFGGKCHRSLKCIQMTFTLTHMIINEHWLHLIKNLILKDKNNWLKVRRPKTRLFGGTKKIRSIFFSAVRKGICGEYWALGFIAEDISVESPHSTFSRVKSTTSISIPLCD